MRANLRRQLTALLAATALASAAGCSHDSAQQSSSTASSGSGGGSAASSGPAVASVDSSLVGATAVTFDAQKEGVTATTPRFAQARNLSQAVEVVRGRMLREGWRKDATKVSVQGSVIAANSAVVGVRMQSTATVGGQPFQQDATLWYSTARKQTYSSSALVKAAQWPAFAKAVVKAVTGQGGDAAKATSALAGMASPYGSGPSLALTSQGDMVVTFSSGVLGGKPVAVTIPAADAKGYLSVLGTQALAASTSPSAFNGTTTEGADPELTTGVVGSRPSTAVGPDCRVLHCAAVTYDDGPSAMTPELLATIKKNPVSITFFQMGNSIRAYPEIARQVGAAGMEIGNHTMTHPNLPSKTPERIARELDKDSDLIKGFMGATPLLFRPPYGAHNQTVDAVAKKGGMAIIQWEIDTEDWRTHSVSKTVQVATTAKNYHATIVLEHDIQQASIKAAPQVYKTLLADGLSLVSVSELTMNSGGVRTGHAYCRGTSLKQEGFNCRG